MSVKKIFGVACVAIAITCFGFSVFRILVSPVINGEPLAIQFVLPSLAGASLPALLFLSIGLRQLKYDLITEENVAS